MAASYTLDDLQIDISDLHSQLTAIRDILHEMEYGTGSTRNHELDRVAAMNRIADDMTGRMVDLVDEHYHSIKADSGGQHQLRKLALKMAKAVESDRCVSRDPLLSLIEEHDAAKVALNASPIEDSSEEAAFWTAHNALSEKPPSATTLEGAVAAIRLARDEEETCGSQEALTVNLLTAALTYFDASVPAKASA